MGGNKRTLPKIQIHILKNVKGRQWIYNIKNLLKKKKIKGLIKFLQERNMIAKLKNHYMPGNHSRLSWPHPDSERTGR